MPERTEDAVITAWARAARILAFEMEAELAKVGVTLAELEILRALTRTCSLRMSELADIAVLTKSGATRAVNHMEKSGWVERRGSGTDRRSLVVSITPEGHDKFVAASEVIAPVVDDYLLDHLSPKDTRTLLRLLGDVVATREEKRL